MKNSAAVAVIGGGVIGASIAYHLARNGQRDVLIIDRAPAPGAGSTGKATGGFRAQFATAINVRLSLLARAKLLHFEEDTGADPGYSPVGYLWLASTEEQLDALRTAQSVQHSEGLHEAIELDVAGARDVNPVISADGIVGAAFCPTDGYIKPLEILRGYLEAATRLGVDIEWSTECRDMTVDADGSIRQLHTSRGVIDVDVVVNAGGPWAARIATMAAVQVPVSPLMRQAVLTCPTPLIPPSMPMTIFVGDGFHLRARDGRAMLCWPDPRAPGEPGELRAEQQWIESVTRMAHERVPVLRAVPIDRPLAYAGLYEMSPDDHAIIGVAPACPNMFFANGSSGHGVMHSPAIGEIVADMILGRQPSLDVTALRPTRFEEGGSIRAVELI